MLCLAPCMTACQHCGCCTSHRACTRAGSPQVRTSASDGTARSTSSYTLSSCLERSKAVAAPKLMLGNQHALQLLLHLLQLSAAGPQVASANLTHIVSSETLTSSCTFSSSLWLARSSLRRRSYSNCSPALPGASVAPGRPPLRLARRGLPLRLPSPPLLLPRETLSRAVWLPLVGRPTSRLLAPSKLRPLAVWLPSLVRLVLGPVEVRSRAVWLPSRRASLLARRSWGMLDLCAADKTINLCAAQGAAQGAQLISVPGARFEGVRLREWLRAGHLAGAAGWGALQQRRSQTRMSQLDRRQV